MTKAIFAVYTKTILINIILFHSALYGQKAPINTKTTTMKYGSIIEIKRGSKVVFKDGLSISLLSFSHKNSTDRITKASVYMLLSIDNEQTEKFLSIYSNDDKKSEEELNSFEYTKTVKGDDGFEYTTTTRNHSRFIFWKNYQIQLKEFEYDEFIKILVTQKTE
ncbi:hypothetical protein ACWGOQ_0022520 [Aquimarina sp. M1]